MKIKISKPDKNGKRKHNKVVVEPYDVWSFDQTLAPIIAQGLRLIRNSEYFGIPHSYLDRQEEYIERFDHMIECFEKYSTDWEGDIYEKYPAKLNKDQMRQINEELLITVDDFQKGFDFFAENYMNLWT